MRNEQPEQDKEDERYSGGHEERCIALLSLGSQLSVLSGHAARRFGAQGLVPTPTEAVPEFF